MQSISFDQWKSDIVQGIEFLAHTTEKGDRFVPVILRNRYQLSEDDAVNATAAAAELGQLADQLFQHRPLYVCQIYRCIDL